MYYRRGNLDMESKFLLIYVIVHDLLTKLEDSPLLIYSSDCSILKRLQLNLLYVLDILDIQMSTEKRFINLLHMTHDKYYSVSEAPKELIIRVDYIPAMTTWFQSLRVLLDETSHAFDDIFNNISLILRKEPGGGGITTTSDSTLDYLIQQFMIDHGVSVLVDKLQDIVAHRPPDPIPDIPTTSPSSSSSPDIPTTSPSSSSSFVIPRPKDQNSIIELLLGSSQDDDDVHVIPIMGDVGIGKTTLAKLVYNDERVDSHFDKKMWISLSDCFHLSPKDYSSSFVGDESNQYPSLTTIIDTNNNLHLLQTKIGDSLLGKKFLLVLDGVSNNICCKWDVIRVPFFGVGVGKGSRILITTRSRLVSSKLGTVPPYQLQPLSNNDCWSLFRHFVPPRPDPELRQPSEEVMKSFEGHPSIIAAIGSVYNSCLSKNLKDAFDYSSERWFSEVKIERSPRTLLRKYHGLSSPHLKQCFVYCSLFPKGYSFNRRNLLLIWMAEGFLQPAKPGTNMEDLGISYFNELLEISFLRSLYNSDSDPQYHDDEMTIYLMPDCVHDLAEFISSCGGEYHKLRLHDKREPSRMVRDICEYARHSSLFCEATELKTLKASFSKSKGLRSLLVCCRGLGTYVPLNYLTCLRVLDLSYAGLSKLPDSIFNMIHLKYLDLSNNKIKHLPETIGLLQNLETFRIGSCTRVKTFPTDMGKLLNLRHLEIGSGYYTSLVPPGIEKLTNLQTLLPFTIGERHDENGRIKVLRELKNLRGSLILFELENLLHDQEEIKECGGYCLADKENLHKLELHWEYRQESETAEDVLESLRPHTNLRHLIVRGYVGVEFSDWVGNPSFSNLEIINLKYCWYCEVLPPLGQLPYLKYLEIRSMECLKCIDDRFFSSSSSIGMGRFPSLKTLRFAALPCLETFTGLKEGDMPLLEQLLFDDCETLISLPSFKFLHSLRRLDIICCTSLNGLPDKLPPTSLKVIYVYKSPSISKACKKDEVWRKILKKTIPD